MPHARRSRPLTSSCLAACAALAVAAASPDANADPLPDGAQTGEAPGPIAVTIHSSDVPLLVELYHPKARIGVDLPIARCATPCAAHLEAGKYRLFVRATRDTVEGSRVIVIDAPARIEVDPDSDTQRPTGLALGIGGGVASIAGAFMVLANTCLEECRHETNGGVALAGVVLMLGGLVATPIGWVVFARSFRPEVDVSSARALPPSTFAGSPATPSRTQPLGLGFSVRF